MKNAYTRIILLGLVSLVHSLCVGQESPYYQKPTERSLTNNEIALPNLKTEKVYWYFGGNGGLKLAFQEINNNLGGSLSSSNINTTYGEAYFGVNHDDQWQAELGYIKNPFRLQWQFNERNLRAPIQFVADQPSHGVSLKFKKRLFTLDKITRNTRLNLTSGIIYAVDRKNRTVSDYRFGIPTGLTQNGYTDTLRVAANFTQKAAPFSGEIGLELINRLANPVEIGVFAKYVLNGKDILKGTLTTESNFQEAETAELNLNGSNFMLGLTIRWNFLHGIRYIPEIE